MELLESSPSDLKKSYVLHNMANIHRILGDPDRALEYLTQAGELSDRRHLPVQWSFHLTAIAHVHLAQGRIEDAVRTYEDSVAVARRARYAEGLAQSLRPLGELLAGIGRPAEALPYLREAAELFGQLGNPDREADVWRKTAEAAERANAPDQAVEAWSRSRSLAETLDDPAMLLEAVEGIARVRRQQGDREGAGVALTEALDLARRGGSGSGKPPSSTVWRSSTGSGARSGRRSPGTRRRWPSSGNWATTPTPASSSTAWAPRSGPWAATGRVEPCSRKHWKPTAEPVSGSSRATPWRGSLSCAWTRARWTKRSRISRRRWRSGAPSGTGRVKGG
jgi:tetratricopeptide (TPR) repeat protein